MEKRRDNRYLLLASIVVVLLALITWIIIQGNDSHLPQGTSVAGIDLSGKSSSEAVALLRQETKRPKIILASSDARSEGRIDRRPDIARVAKELRKLEADQGFFDLLFDKQSKKDLQLSYGFNEKKLAALFSNLKKRSEKKPSEARVFFAGKLQIKAGKTGYRLQQKSWQQTKQAARQGSRLVLLKREAWRPRLLNKRDVFRDSPAILVVDKSSYTLSFYDKGKLKKTYPVAVGQPGFETPSGYFRISNKAVDPAWNVPEWGGALAGQVIPGGTAENPLVNRWLGIADGVGIHGTNDTYSLGSAASHGCIRMDPEQVIELYDLVPVNSRVIIL